MRGREGGPSGGSSWGHDRAGKGKMPRCASSDVSQRSWPTGVIHVVRTGRICPLLIKEGKKPGRKEVEKERRKATMAGWWPRRCGVGVGGLVVVVIVVRST
jgi:hypothetical protein